MSLKTLNMILLIAVVLLTVLCGIQMRLLYRYLHGSVFGRITMPLAVEWPEQEPVIIWLGDSRIRQWDPMPQIQEYRLINLGQNGLTSSQLLFQLLHLDLPPYVKGAVIQIGINDLKAIGLAPDNADEIVRQCRANITECVELLQQKEIRVVQMPIVPPAHPGLLRKLIWSDKISPAVGQVNDHIKTMLPKRAVMPELDELTDEHGQLKTQYRLDTLHLNRAGYRRLNEIMTPVMNKTFLETQD